MELEYKGANCITIKTREADIVIDPKLSRVGLKDITKAKVQIATNADFLVSGTDMLSLEGPGEYEVEGVSVRGIPAQRHTDLPEEGRKNTMYRLETSDVALAVVGHITPGLSEEQAEALGVIDILVIPVGGNGYTLDAHAAVELVRMLDPKVVIPTHYADKNINYEVPPAELELFLKELGATHEQMPKLKLKTGAALPEALTVYELARTS